MSDAAQRALLRNDLRFLFAETFSSTLELRGGPRVVALVETLSDDQQLELAGLDVRRARVVRVQSADLAGCGYQVGTRCILDGDPQWQIHRAEEDPDGAMVTLTLIDAR